jgi:hypothetical protein
MKFADLYQSVFNHTPVKVYCYLLVGSSFNHIPKFCGPKMFSIIQKFFVLSWLCMALCVSAVPATAPTKAIKTTLAPLNDIAFGTKTPHVRRDSCGCGSRKQLNSADIQQAIKGVTSHKVPALGKEWWVSDNWKAIIYVCNVCSVKLRAYSLAAW